MPFEQGPPSTLPPAQLHRHLWDPRRATGRLSLAALFAIVVTCLSPARFAWHVRAVAGWDAGAALFMLLAWWIILKADAGETARRAGAEDPGRFLVWFIAIASSVFSFFSATIVLRQVKAFAPSDAGPWTLMTLAAVVLSWFLTHTAYTMRYAHLYYRRGGVGGLDFPGARAPTDIDFAYFSFTLGMCFQVSDVTVTSSNIRRAVLLHALISFIYNTTILALALNIVLGLFA